MWRWCRPGRCSIPATDTMRSPARLRLLTLMGVFSVALWSTSAHAQPIPADPPSPPPPTVSPPAGAPPSVDTPPATPAAPAPASSPDPAAPRPSIADAPGPDSPQLRGETIPADQVRQTTGGGGVEGEDVALFLPRAVFFLPARVIQLVSIPVRGGLTFVQKHYVLEEIEDFFYNDERTAAIVPSISLSTFFGAQIGARAFHRDMGGHGERGDARVSFGAYGEHISEVSFNTTRAGGTGLWVETLAGFEQHPQLRFYGIGDGDVVEDPDITGVDARSGQAVESYFLERRVRQITTLGVSFGEPGQLEVRAGARGRFKHYDFEGPRGLNGNGDRSTLTAYDTSTIPGFDDGATVLETEGVMVLDGRDKKGATSSGIYAEAFGGGAPPFGDFRYARFGAEVTGYIDLYRGNRVLMIRGVLDGVAGQDDEIPFVELPSLGGPRRLRGYPLDRFRDEKAFVGTLEYHYPIHQLLAGTLFVDAGEVRNEIGELFSDPKFHVGGGGGLQIRDEDSIFLTLEVAGGEGVQVYVTTDPLRAFADRDDDL